MTTTARTSRARAMGLSALATPPCLVAGIAVGFALGFLVSARLPGHMTQDEKTLYSVVPALAGIVAGGAVWGGVLARITGAGERRRMALAGALSVGPAVVAAALSLATLEGIIVERRQGPDLPVHQVFTLLFVPAAALVAAAGALAVSLAAGKRAHSVPIALGVGLAGGAAFLLVDLLMDGAGWRVGAPGAADRATMLTVAGMGALGASAAGGAVLGWVLAANTKRTSGARVLAADPLIAR